MFDIYGGSVIINLIFVIKLLSKWLSHSKRQLYFFISNIHLLLLIFKYFFILVNCYIMLSFRKLLLDLNSLVKYCKVYDYPLKSWLYWTWPLYEIRNMERQTCQILDNHFFSANNIIKCLWIYRMCWIYVSMYLYNYNGS